MCFRILKCVLLLSVVLTEIESRKFFTDTPVLNFGPCFNGFRPHAFLKSWYNYGTYPMGEENQYSVGVDKFYPAGTTINCELNMAATVEMIDAGQLDIKSKTKFAVTYTKDSTIVRFKIKGSKGGPVPYFTSIKINGVEECRSPVVGYLNKVVEDIRLALYVKLSLPVRECGRKKIYSEFIYNGDATEPGDWPWHVALYKRNKVDKSSYICGGTLISKYFVLSAAHCVHDVVSTPKKLSVVLGKHQLETEDNTSELKEVSFVTVHEQYGRPNSLDNDIALLKLRTEAIFSNYIQPACLWSNSVNGPATETIMGSVVGWGYTEAQSLSLVLKHAQLPILTYEKCVKSNFVFYGAMLHNDKKFCAGWGNGTSSCNGDSGGGFLVFVPDASDKGSNSGAWYVRGITSIGIKNSDTGMCDPNKYVVYTDTSSYADWIRTKAFENISHQQ